MRAPPQKAKSEPDLQTVIKATQKLWRRHHLSRDVVCDGTAWFYWGDEAAREWNWSALVHIALPSVYQNESTVLSF